MRRRNTAFRSRGPNRPTRRGAWKALPALVLTLALVAPANAQDDETKLTAAEITTLLSDRTALGEHRGTATRQYFDPSGWTDYLAEGAQPDRGTWRVDAARDQYCSEWGPFGGWSCYDVTTDGERYYWSRPADGTRSPFTMVDGHKLTF